MRTTLLSLLAGVLALSLLSANALASGGNRQGTAAADQLLIPVGARGIALGGSYSAGMSGINAIYYNPAGLSASSSRAEAMFSQLSQFGDVSISSVAVGAGVAGFGHIAFSLKALSFGDLLITDERNPDGTGATYSPTFVTLGLTYSRALTDRIRAGLTVNMVTESIDRVSATGFAVDAGVQYNGLAGVRGLQLGVALKHLGANMTYDGAGLYRSAKESAGLRDAQLLKIDAAGFGMPTALELALAYSQTFQEMHALTLAGSFENNNYLADQWRVGLEYSFRNMFHIRGSYTFAGNEKTDLWDETQTAYLFGLALGAGVSYDVGGLVLGFDYAYRASQIFDGSHAFTVNVAF